MRGQLTALVRSLTQICQTIHPNKDTFSAYGHDIRNLLILSCTEVESHWRGILVANNVKKDRFTTVQYVKLLSAMQLHKYRIALPHYPWLEPLVPFAEWTPKAPTKSLAWYNAYNHVKHDREGKFADAQLIHAINAVAACAILLCAQVGTPLALRPRGEIGEFIQLLDAPTWAPNEVYTDRYEGWAANNDPVPYPFA